MKTFFKDLQGYLAGKKAYLLGIIMIGIGFYLKDNSLILEGLGLMTLRAGISKVK